MRMRHSLSPLALAGGLALAGPAGLHAGDPMFNPAVLHETRIEMDPSDWQALRDNFRSNQYYAANLSLDGEVVQQVGIRSRGLGSRNETKPGLRLDFNRYVATQEFHGYKSAVLDNNVEDETMMKERLAYLVFEAMGIAAPQIAHTRLTVNGQYWGLYSLIESISKPFLEHRFGEKNLTLFDYEYAYDYDFSYRGPDPASYIPSPFEPQTNEDKPDVGAGLVAFIDAINNTPDATFLSTISSFLDVDRFLTHVAIENALAEDDGIV